MAKISSALLLSVFKTRESYTLELCFMSDNKDVILHAFANCSEIFIKKNVCTFILNILNSDISFWLCIYFILFYF